MTRSQRIFVDGIALDHVVLHDDVRKTHLSYEWKGGERNGRYYMYNAFQCVWDDKCSTKKLPDDWRVSAAERPKMVQWLKANTTPMSQIFRSPVAVKRFHQKQRGVSSASKVESDDGVNADILEHREPSLLDDGYLEDGLPLEGSESDDEWPLEGKEEE